MHDLQQKLHDNRHELTAVQNSTIPFDHAIQGLNSLLEAEEKRLNILMTNPNSELYQNARGELLSSRKSFTGRKSSLPGSPGRLSQAPNTSGTSRSKGSPVPNGGKSPILFLTLSVPTPPNGQTYSNNSLALADEVL